jgi:hypothetical protein
VGPPQYVCLCQADQGARRRFRCCLLKGCERPFWASRPQCRYCSVACRQQAQRWRRWYASGRYRATEQGKERRRAQSRRYRERLRQRASVVLAAAADSAPTAVVEAREGQRPAKKDAVFLGRPCRRPGCYEVFAVPRRSPAQSFCSCLCRRALRRVLDREAHWRRRRRSLHRPCRPPTRPPPATS